MIMLPKNKLLVSALHRRGHNLSGNMGSSQGLTIMIRKGARHFFISYREVLLLWPINRR